MKLRRLSLQNLLFLVACVGVSLALYVSLQSQWRMQAELATLRDENQRIRAEFGFLDVADPQKIHAVRVPFSGPGRTWTYRVFLPDGGNQYYVACRINDLPLDGELPQFGGNPPGVRTISSGGKNSTGIGLTGGEYLITLSVFVEDGLPKYTIHCRASDVSKRSGQGGGTGGSGIVGAENKWPIRRGAFALGGVAQQATVAPADEPLVLLDYRFISEGIKESNRSDQGIIAWIEMLP